MSQPTSPSGWRPTSNLRSTPPTHPNPLHHCRRLRALNLWWHPKSPATPTSQQHVHHRIIKQIFNCCITCRCIIFFVWSVLVFYFANRSHQNSNLMWIQISLKIIKRYEKEKDFSNPYSVMGQNPAHPGASLAHPPFTLSCAWPSSRPTGPAGSLLCWLSAWPSIAEPRPTRPIFMKPSSGPPKSMLSSPAGSLLHRRKFPPTMFFTRILQILTKSKTSLRLEIDTTSTTCMLRWGPTTPINRRRISSNFQPQAPKP
jgi:hypothetical protein